MINSIIEYIYNLGKMYGVNPFIFAGIYIGAIPFFFLSLGWVVRNYKKGYSVTLPIISAGFFFISAYLYLLIFGHNVPLWVYGILIVLIAYGAYSSIKSTKKKIQK